MILFYSSIIIYNIYVEMMYMEVDCIAKHLINVHKSPSMIAMIHRITQQPLQIPMKFFSFLVE